MKFSILFLAYVVCSTAWAEETKKPVSEQSAQHAGEKQNADGTWSKVDAELSHGGKKIREFLFSENTNKDFEKRKAEQGSPQSLDAAKKADSAPAAPAAQAGPSTDTGLTKEANGIWDNVLHSVNRLLKTQQTQEKQEKVN